jgi:general transcription factor 3C polypeptide 3 (transcription factor C subunit 4)
MGISHLHRAMQRKSSDRHEHITCAFMFFLQYQELCESKLESYYNLGRAFHHIGLYHLAIDYYEKGLAFGSNNEKNNLCHEIAFNLSLIYCQSGSYLLAKEILKRHNTFDEVF